MTQQPLPNGQVGTLSAHRGLERETPAVYPAAHFVTIALIEQTVAGRRNILLRCISRLP